MKRHSVLFGLVLICSCWLALTSALAGSTPDACGLFTRTDAESLFKQSVSDGVSRTTRCSSWRPCSNIQRRKTNE